jgi:hypothetical protein
MTRLDVTSFHIMSMTKAVNDTKPLYLHECGVDEGELRTNGFVS